jgi:hypothetical protein
METARILRLLEYTPIPATIVAEMMEFTFDERGFPVAVIDKAELLANVREARTKAQNASEKLRLARERHGWAPIPPPLGSVDVDALELHYRRAVEELEHAINAAGVTEYDE